MASGQASVRTTGSGRPTLKDVAARAGLSVIVASNTFSRPDRVSERSRARIITAARELGYRPNRAAQALRTGRTGQLGVVVSEHLGYAFRDPGAGRFLSGVADVCAEQGIGMTLLPTGDHLSGPEAVHVAAVDGFVFWTTTAEDPALVAAVESGTPVTVQGGPFLHGVTTVAIDDAAAARAITLLALDRGPRLAVVTFPTHRGRAAYTTTLADVTADLPVTAARLAGVRQAVVAAGHSPGSVSCHVTSVNDRGEAKLVTGSLLAAHPRLDAIVCLSDELALGVDDALRARCSRPPLLTGFDATPEALERGILSVAQDLHAQGRQCADISLGLTTETTQPGWEIRPAK